MNFAIEIVTWDGCSLADRPCDLRTFCATVSSLSMAWSLFLSCLNSMLPKSMTPETTFQMESRSSSVTPMMRSACIVAANSSASSMPPTVMSFCDKNV